MVQQPAIAYWTTVSYLLHSHRLGLRFESTECRVEVLDSNRLKYSIRIIITVQCNTDI